MYVSFGFRKYTLSQFEAKNDDLTLITFSPKGGKFHNNSFDSKLGGRFINFEKVPSNNILWLNDGTVSQYTDVEYNPLIHMLLN